MSVKLYYFGIRGRMEIPRLILEDNGASYENVIVSNWPEIKGDSERFYFNQLPMAEFGSFRLCQSKAIIRHLGRLHNLYGATAEEQSYVDMILDGVEDFFTEYAKAFFRDRSLLDGFLATTAPTWIARFTRLLERNANGDHFFLGEHISIADYALFDVLDALVALKAEILDASPKLKAYYERIKARPNLAAYFASDRRLPSTSK
eukprot:TRINITY_DN5018_c0_g1_i2.p1 TRINITY_DN5018_c0_g1~~TRINITY_DN5018_c0_g1_i2.p1  ORF type:complete len:204 (-),score=54.60 TRINITY_DN5018_c0_g1_i2:40-651(-)